MDTIVSRGFLQAVTLYEAESPNLISFKSLNADTQVDTAFAAREDQLAQG